MSTTITLTRVEKENNLKSTIEKNYSSALSQFLLMATDRKVKKKVSMLAVAAALH
jgi:hypothetical protein